MSAIIFKTLKGPVFRAGPFFGQKDEQTGWRVCSAGFRRPGSLKIKQEAREDGIK